MMTRTIPAKVIGKTEQQGLFGKKYRLAVQLIDHSANDRVSIDFRISFGEYCQFKVGDTVNTYWSSDDGIKWYLGQSL